MTETELRLYSYAVALAVKLDASNPEVGFGSSPSRIAKTMADRMDLDITEDDLAQVMDFIKKNKNLKYR